MARRRQFFVAVSSLSTLPTRRFFVFSLENSYDLAWHCEISRDPVRCRVVTRNLAKSRNISHDHTSIGSIWRDSGRSRVISLHAWSRPISRNLVLSVLTGSWHGRRAAIYHRPACGSRRLLGPVPRRGSRHLAAQVVLNRKCRPARAQCGRPADRLTGRARVRNSERGTYLSASAHVQLDSAPDVVFAHAPFASAGVRVVERGGNRARAGIDRPPPPPLRFHLAANDRRLHRAQVSVRPARRRRPGSR